MDSIDRTELLLQQVNLKISELLQIVGDLLKDPDALNLLRPKALREMEGILDGVRLIGGKLFDEAKILQAQLLVFLEKPSEEGGVKVMQGAFYIKHEVREI